MAARGGDLQCVPQIRLAAQVGEVRPNGPRPVQAELCGRWWRLLHAPELPQLLEPLERDHPRAAAEGPPPIRWPPGTAIAVTSSLAAASAIASVARHGPDRAVQGELTGQHHALEPLGRKLARRNQKAAAIARSKLGPGLAEVRRRQVGGDPVLWEVEAGVLERGADPLARLAHGSVGQAHQEKAAGPRSADVHLDVDLADLDAEQAESTRRGEHAGDATGRVFAGGTPVVPDP